jgi:hypothetical protein
MHIIQTDDFGLGLPLLMCQLSPFFSRSSSLPLKTPPDACVSRNAAKVVTKRVEEEDEDEEEEDLMQELHDRLGS